MAVRPIHRIKHVVDNQGALTSPTILSTLVANAVDTPVTSSVTQVEVGSKINGIYLRVEIAGNETGAIPNCYLIVYKNPGGNLTMPSPNAVGSDDNKKWVIHQEMLMLQNLPNGNPRSLFNGVIVIPKGMRRMGVNDTIRFDVFSPNVNLFVCSQSIYKEFR